MPTKLLGNLSEGLAFIVSAPAGTGKTTLVQMLVQEFPCVVASISCTTRSPRPGEIPDVDYHFLNEKEFQKRVAAHEFLEHAQLYGCYYGTSKETIEMQRKSGKHVILTIDTQGALQLKGKYKATYIFIHPPSLEELRRRLELRKTETPKTIEQRLAKASQELEASSEYDYQIVNDDLRTAYQVLRSIVIAKEHCTEYRTIEKVAVH
jgi:guanylate kinase